MDSKDFMEAKDFVGGDGVFSVPQVPGVNGLPRERAHRYSGGNSEHRPLGMEHRPLSMEHRPINSEHRFLNAENRLLRIKSERELSSMDFVKLEPLYGYNKPGDGTTGLFHVPGGVPVVPRRRESLPDEYLSFREHRRAEFEVPLNLTDRNDYRRTNSGPEPRGSFKEELCESDSAVRTGVYSPEGPATEGFSPGGQEERGPEGGGSSRTVIGTKLILLASFMNMKMHFNFGWYCPSFSISITAAWSNRLNNLYRCTRRIMDKICI